VEHTLSSMKSLSIVVPIYRDGALARDFCQSLEQTAGDLAAAGVNQFEVIFVADGIAGDIPHLRETCGQFSFAKYIAFTRNFGQHIAISCGLTHSTGDLAVYMDVDMEDPPSELPKLIRELERTGSEVCVGLRIRKKVSVASRLTSRIFHTLLTRLTGLSMPANGTTMRVMTRNFLNAFVKLSEKERYLPGIQAWLGHKTCYLPIVQQARTQGETSYSFRKKLRMAIAAVLSFSDLPLRMVVRIGFGISALSFVMAGLLVVSRLFFADFQPGYTSTTTLIMFFGGFQIFVTGLSGLYIGRILREVQNRPLYVIGEKFNID
jgi:glycosyltransferase involved in cell wall biosynthesis